MMRVNAKTCAQARIDEGGDEHGRGRRRGEISICAVQITKKTYENISALNRLKLKPNKCDCKVCVCMCVCVCVYVCVLLHTHRERETGWEEGWGGERERDTHHNRHPAEAVTQALAQHVRRRVWSEH